MSVTVALDTMSGDGGCAVAVRAARQFIAQNPHAKFILVGDEQTIKRELAKPPPRKTAAARALRAGGAENCAIAHADEVIHMRDKPSHALRRRNTSMRRALELVRDGEAQAAVSAGNTGALMGLSVLTLGTLDGIARPAIASFIPNRRQTSASCMLDLGANVKCSADMLRDFALMGAMLTKAIKNIAAPRVGLLNIGEEAHKGGGMLKDATRLLSADPRINFIGNVEGNEMYSSASAKKADVIICDGFTGNVALKVSEGLANMMLEMLKDEVHGAGLLRRLYALLAAPFLLRLRPQFDHRQYNGACLVGLNHVVVKSHGNADEVAFVAALATAVGAAAQNLPRMLQDSIAQAVPRANSRAAAAGAGITAGAADATAAAGETGDSGGALPPSAPPPLSRAV